MQMELTDVYPKKDYNAVAVVDSEEAVPSLGQDETQSKSSVPTQDSPVPKRSPARIVDGGEAEFQAMLRHLKELVRPMHVTVKFKGVNLYNYAAEPTIPSVGGALLGLAGLGGGEKRRVDILKDVSGRLAPFKMTLLLGPPGSGRSVLMRSIAQRLRTTATLEGEFLYNDTKESPNTFLVPKLVDYIEQGDHHAPTLTVEETLKYAWMCTTGGHHSYAQAAHSEAQEQMNFEDEHFTKVHNVLTSLGLIGCKDTYVGDDVIRGVSGGQKKRVTVGEMLVCPRPVKILDSVTNGLDTATAVDIIRTFRDMSHILGMTYLCSLLQPPPEVYDLFDEVMILSEGQIIFHGPRERVLPYFESLGYVCPAHVDPADFLQELPTAEGKHYIREDMKQTAPRGTEQLVAAWKKHDLYIAMMEEVNNSEAPAQDIEKGTAVALSRSGKHAVWHADLTQMFPGSYWYHFGLTLKRQVMLTLRDDVFIKTRISQNIFTGVLSGTLFLSIKPTEVITMNGLLFYGMLSSSLGSFSMLPMIFHQKQVHYKQNGALFYPSSAFVFSQAMALIPLQLVETVLFSLILYWCAGLAEHLNGSRFFTFILLNFVFSVSLSQFYRWIGFLTPNMETALPFSGICIMLFILFCGFIQPKSIISDGWIWMYWANPVSWGIKAVTINEFKAPKYDFAACLNEDCSLTQRFGDFVLSSYGNPTDENYIWYCLAVIVGFFLFYLTLSTLTLKYAHWEPSPPPPIPMDLDVTAPDMDSIKAAELPYEPTSFAFKDIWYTITMPDKEERDLLKGVSGHFYPGTMTALMGASGAGKTTLLDVLSGRKNQGKIRGEMFVNGRPKQENHFRRIMGYVEQFDCLTQRATPFEAIEFSAALRLPSHITAEQRSQWVETVIDMLELRPIMHKMIGETVSGGMTFEQRKRVSIGVELAANPSILFLDEPTTGLDSRAAQVIVRNIRRIAQSGRCVICTIHQPSTPIFNAFDSLLLLKKGGQTVFFGEIGQEGKKLVEYFEAQPGVKPITPGLNPATWMLDVIGAGTTMQEQTEDYHVLYKQSALFAENEKKLSELVDKAKKETEADPGSEKEDGSYRASYLMQFQWLTWRAFLTYWRNPSYSLGRFVVNILVALIFGSAYPQQKYSTYIDVVSRCAVIYITAMFCGILGMMSVAPVTLSDRAVFYREDHSKMYSTAIYSFVYNLVELPYLVLSSLAFVLPFFFIVGFDNVGNVTDKFFWYWLFAGLLISVLVYLGQFFSVLMPTDETVTAVSGLASTVTSLYCGFLIRYQNFPPFWTFMYWLSPLHYGLEGLIVTQFYGDTTEISLADGTMTTAEEYVKGDFEAWRYSHRGDDILALCLFIGASWVGRYLCLRYLRHEKR